MLERCYSCCRSQDLHGPGDVWFWDTFHQTQQWDIGFWSGQNLFLPFFQVHSRRNCKFKFHIYLPRKCCHFFGILSNWYWKKNWPLTTTETGSLLKTGLPLICAWQMYVPASSLFTFWMISVLLGNCRKWLPTDGRGGKAIRLRDLNLRNSPSYETF